MKMFANKILNKAVLLTSTIAFLAPTLARAEQGYEGYQSPARYETYRNGDLIVLSDNGISEWLAEKLASGIVGAAGAQIFGELEKGIGIKDKQSEIFDLLTQVMARIQQIQASLDKIETEVKEARYETGIRPINEAWVTLSTQANFVIEQNKLALANMKDGQVIDAAKAKRIGDNIREAEDKILTAANAVLDKVYANFVTGSDVEPLQKIFADIQRNKTAIIDADYFKKINDQLEKYRSYQAVALALALDIERARGQVEKVDSEIAVRVPQINAEKIAYPSDRFFTLEETVKRVANKEAIYDRGQDLLWELSYLNFPSTAAFWNYATYRPQGRPMPPTQQMVHTLLNEKGVPLQAFAKSAKALGFKDAEADATKMVVLWTWTSTHYPEGLPPWSMDWFLWFGNDQDPRQYVYEDNNARFNEVRNQKQMPKDGVFQVLGAVRLAELTK